MTDWSTSLTTARKASTALTNSLAELNALRDEATAQVVKLGQGAGVELNPDAVKASIDKPYVLIKTDDPNTWKCITWRGRTDMPVVGWIDWQDDAFIVSTINRSMRLVSEIPDWMVEQIGWQPPEFEAALDASKTIVQLKTGDRDEFRRRYGAHLAAAVDGGFKVKKGKAWIELLEKMLHDGIVPFTPKPVVPADWDPNATCGFELRDYQMPYVIQFRQNGAESIILPSGAGKTMIGLYIIAHIVGHTTILCDSDVLVGQWKARVKEYVPKADVEILTFQAAMHRIDKLKGMFLLTDEGHRLPADTWSRLAFTKYEYRALMTATPWRLKRQAMIVALGGPPRVIPWRQLIDAGVLNRPSVRVVIVPTAAFKLEWIKKTLHEHRDANTLIYCDSINQGKEWAAALDLPFIHGETKDKFARLIESRQRIVSKAIEASVDIPDLTLVIEADVSRTGESRISEGQRIGRLLHGRQRGEYFVVLTPDEFSRFRGRMLGVEAELGDIVEYQDLTGQGIKSLQTAVKQPKQRAPAYKPNKSARGTSSILAEAAIAKLLDKSYVGAPAQVVSEHKVHAVLQLGWESPVSIEELVAGKGISRSAVKNYTAAFRIAERDGLMVKVGTGWLTNRAKLEKVVELAKRFK